jgi:predicted PurR-regulated permease PerM
MQGGQDTIGHGGGVDTTVRNTLVILAVIAAGAALHWLADIFTPLVMAIFLTFLIDGLSREIDRRLKFLPDGASLPVALAVIILAFAGSVWLSYVGIGGFVTDLTNFARQVDELATNAAASVGAKPPPKVAEAIGGLGFSQLSAAAGTLFRGLGAAAGALFFLFFTLVYLGFLIASRDNVRRKIVVLFPERDDRKDAMHVFDRVRAGVEGYIWVQTITGLMIAAGCWAVMAAVGLHNALFWAFLIFLLSYIPVIGGAVAGCGPALFALVQFPDELWKAVVLFAVIQAWLFIIGNVILPKMQADDQNIDPIVVLLSLAFWGAIWGATGAFLSTPLTVMLIAIMAEFRGSRWLAVLLSADGDPYPDDEAPPTRDPPMPHPEIPPGHEHLRPAKPRRAPAKARPKKA